MIGDMVVKCCRADSISITKERKVEKRNLLIPPDNTKSLKHKIKVEQRFNWGVIMMGRLSIPLHISWYFSSTRVVQVWALFWAKKKFIIIIKMTCESQAARNYYFFILKFFPLLLLFSCLFVCGWTS